MQELKYQGVFLGEIERDPKPIALENLFDHCDSTSKYDRRPLKLKSPAFFWAGASEPWKMWPDGKYLKGWSKPQYEHSISETILRLLLEAMEAELIMAKVDNYWNLETLRFEGDQEKITLRIIAFSNKDDDALLLEHLAANLLDSDKFDTSGKPKKWFARETNHFRREQKKAQQEKQQQNLKDPPRIWLEW